MNKHRSRNIKRALLATGGVSALGVILFVVLVFRASRSLDIDFDPISFDSATWIASEPEFSLDSLRLRMIDDLLATHNLVGMHRDDIVSLIGEPDDTEYFRDYEMVYYLGQERHPLGIDSEWLAIDLDDNSTATFAGILRD